LIGEEISFNQHLAEVDVGAWPKHDPRALVASILGPVKRP
jgi:hypothetical protein